MAMNPDANPLERHIEKLVLGVCAVVTIVILAGWVVSSPRTVEILDPAGIGATPVPLASADDTLLQGVRRIRQTNQDAQPDPLPRLGWVDQFKVFAGRPFPAGLLLAALDKGTTYPPILRQTPPDSNALPYLAELANVVPRPVQPKVWCGQEVREPTAGLPSSDDDDVVLHGAAVYPWADLEANWRPKISRLPYAYMLVLRVEVQIRSRSPEGAYDGTEGVPARLLSRPPVDEANRSLEMPAIPNYDGANAVAVGAAIEQLRAPNWQKYILTPPYPNVFLANFGWVTWRIHLPDNDVSRRAEANATAPAPTREGPTPEGLGPAYVPPGVVPDPLGGLGPVWSEGVEPLLREPNARKTPRIPELARQKEDGNVLITWHVGGLRIATAYQVRVRVVFLNPLLAQDFVQDKARDSVPKEIVGPWSEWSQECAVENPTRFFLTKPSQQGKLSVIVFTRKMGRIVKQVFDVEPGMAIGGRVNMDLGGLSKAVEVNFSTGCTAIDCDLKRPVLRGSITGSRAAVDTAALLYLDEKGRLRSRLQVDDETSPEYEKLRKEAAP